VGIGRYRRTEPVRSGDAVAEMVVDSSASCKNVRNTSNVVDHGTDRGSARAYGVYREAVSPPSTRTFWAVM